MTCTNKLVAKGKNGKKITMTINQFQGNEEK